VERLIVFSLLFLLPTQLAYHFWPQFAYVHGLRIDYLSPAIYLTDVLILLLIPYLIKRLRFNKVKLNGSVLVILIPAILVALLNIVFAQLHMVTLLKWLSICKFTLLGLYFYLADLPKLRKTIIFALSLSLVAFVSIGLIQFVLQRTIGGPLYYLGERSFTSQTPGIALMSLFGKSLMRAYSTFSHPNSFAGFVVVALFILLSLIRQKVNTLPKSIFVAFISVLASIFLTFSLNAIICTFFVVVLWFVLNNFPKFVRKVKVLLPTLLISFSFFFGAISLMLPQNILLRQTYKERVVLAGQAVEVFVKRPALGVGLNNFFTATKNVQPPHNIYLIVLAETGLFGVLIVFLLLSKLFNRKLNNYLLLALVFVLLTGLFDHYWFTLQQNELILSVLLGLSVRNYNIRNNTNE